MIKTMNMTSKHQEEVLVYSVCGGEEKKKK